MCFVPSRNALSAEDPCFPSSFSILDRYVVVCAVFMPFAVMTAYAPFRVSNSTPTCFAVGMTRPICAASSPTVVLPRFCVWIRTSETLVTSDASMPYAFRAVVRMSVAAAESVKPALASFRDSLTKLTASPVSCPADMALYTLSAMSANATPVSFESSVIWFFNVSRGTAVVSAIVDSFAIESSNPDAMVAITVPIPTIGAVTFVVIVFPTSETLLPTSCSFFPAASIFSAKVCGPDAFFSSFSIRCSSVVASATACFHFSVAVLFSPDCSADFSAILVSSSIRFFCSSIFLLSVSISFAFFFFASASLLNAETEASISDFRVFCC